MRRPLAVDKLITLDNLASGVNQTQVREQLHRYGANDILAAGSSSWVSILRDTARDPMVWFLVLAALLFAVVGDYLEAVVLAVALVPILGMDAFLHRRTQVSTAALAQRLSSIATVLRDGKEQIVPVADLVPGDIVFIRANEYVPADAVFVSGQGLQVDESALTGEAMPVKKSVLLCLTSDSHGDGIESLYWAYAGTRLLTGSAKLLVIYTGQSTHYGEIVRLAQASTLEQTPLQQSIMSLTKVLLLVALVFCVALGVTRVLQGHGWLDALISSITLAVAALPEEFPVVFAVFLGVGIYRLAQNQALVRRAVVVENIGRLTCICTDKTGTLTSGHLIVAHQVPADHVSLEQLLEAGALASRHESMDPLDIALLTAHKAPDFTVLATFPFTEDRRRETRVLERAEQGVVSYVKGAPETVLQMCRLGAEEQNAWMNKALEFASTGHKVIGFAKRAVSQTELPAIKLKQEEPSDGYSFLGLIAFEDPVRPGVKEALQAARTAGIRVIMVTGDHAATAGAIARELGLCKASGPVVVSGESLHEVDLRDVDVVARATPAQKLELVQLLRQQGEIVAVTGDGVNDAPALRGADIGIAMGERGTQAAREVASIVLLDDNFRTIVRAIAEGRQLFANLQMSFAYLLMVHLPLVVTAAWIPFAGYPLLYQPIHIVWLELIIHPTAFLAFQERAERRGLNRDLNHTRQHRAGRGFFNGRQWALILAVGVLITIVMLLTYERSFNQSDEVGHARSMALAILIFCSVGLSMGLGAWRNRLAIGISVAVVAVSLFLMQYPFAAELLHLRPLHWDDWAIVLPVALVTGWLASWVMKCKD